MKGKIAKSVCLSHVAVCFMLLIGGAATEGFSAWASSVVGGATDCDSQLNLTPLDCESQPNKTCGENYQACNKNAGNAVRLCEEKAGSSSCKNQTNCKARNDDKVKQKDADGNDCTPKQISS